MTTEYYIEQRTKLAPTRPRFVISSSNLDLGNDRIMPEALQAIVDAQLPITALTGHNNDKIIGKWTNFALNSAGELEADLVIVDTKDGADVQKLLDAGVPLRASIGFRGRGRKNKDGGIDFTEVDLKEVSVVVSPANLDARRVKDDTEAVAERRKFSDLAAADESPDLWRALVPLMKATGMKHDAQLDAVQALCEQIEKAFAAQNSAAFVKSMDDELALARAKAAALAEMEDE